MQVYRPLKASMIFLSEPYTRQGQDATAGRGRGRWYETSISTLQSFCNVWVLKSRNIKRTSFGDITYRKAHKTNNTMWRLLAKQSTRVAITWVMTWDLTGTQHHVPLHSHNIPPPGGYHYVILHSNCFLPFPYSFPNLEKVYYIV